MFKFVKPHKISTHLAYWPPRLTVSVTKEGVSFHQNFVNNGTKIEDTEEGLSFSPEFDHRHLMKKKPSENISNLALP